MFPVFFLLLVYVVRSHAFFQGFFQSNTQLATSLKQEILNLSRRLERGVIETPEEADEMLSLFSALEKMNPTKNSLNSARWPRGCHTR